MAVRTRRIGKEKYINFLIKSDEFHRSALGVMREELDSSMRPLTALLEVLNIGEYEDRLPSQSEMKLALQDSEQSRLWALSRLPDRASS